ncbi:MAG: DUF6527 family protein [bacterium]|nr:DUF6527 family protein [bacterium]
MRRETILKHEFVEYIPKDVQEGTIYVSIAFATAIHKCCCGCGGEVVTPLSPTDWKLIFDGESISLDPSIGNWSFACQSHYWIKRNRVTWAPQWSREEIESGRAYDQLAKEKFFESTKTPAIDNTLTNAGRSREGKSKEGFWSKLKRWWS